jgi:hypothetical protein
MELGQMGPLNGDLSQENIIIRGINDTEFVIVVTLD